MKLKKKREKIVKPTKKWKLVKAKSKKKGNRNQLQSRNYDTGVGDGW